MTGRPMAGVVTAALLAAGMGKLPGEEQMRTVEPRPAAMAASGADRGDSPRERMQRRFPQPVRVGDLIGLPVLDDDNATIGRVRQVVRSPQGAIVVIVSYGGWFGFGSRPVAVPIEVLGIFGHQLASLDMKPEEYAAAPPWPGSSGQILAGEDTIEIALARR